VRAHDVTVDASLLWVGAGLAVAVAVLLAFVPRLPSSSATKGINLGGRSLRLTSGTSRRLRVFAITQIAASFVLVAGAGMLITTLFALQRQQTGFRGNVLAVNVPVVSYERKPADVAIFYKEAIRRISGIAGVDRVALGTVVPWRDPGFFSAQFTAEGYKRASGEEDPRARFRTVSPGFFEALGVRMIAGREFNDSDRADGEKVVIISESVAKRMFPSLDAVNRKVMWTDPVTKFIGVSTGPRRIVGVAADIDDENLVPEPAMTVYHPLGQEMAFGRLFIHAKVDPYTLVTPVTKIIRELAADQPVERAATLDDIRSEVLSPTRINALVFSGFAGVALLIAVVGVAGVLAFSVSARTREFGVRLAMGSTPRHLLTRVLREGAAIGVLGIVAGAAGGWLLARVAGSVVAGVAMPGVVPIAAAAAVLIGAAIVASVTPAARASRVDVIQALRSE
jgi:predicted permease